MFMVELTVLFCASEISSVFLTGQRRNSKFWHFLKGVSSVLVIEIFMKMFVCFLFNGVEKTFLQDGWIFTYTVR